MGTANRTQLAFVREVTPGTTPVTPRMRTARYVSESLSFTPNYVSSDEIRADRMKGDPIKVMQASEGGINFELSYPDDNTFLSDVIRSAFFNTWTNTNFRDNDGTADSVITDVATTNEVVTCTTGTAFVAGHLCKFTGFGVTLNNGNAFKCTTGSATVPRFLGAGLTNETAPPAAARIKVVGVQGASGDITATASGLACTALNFTDFPELAVGRWIKIDSTTVANGFDSTALNTFIRITAVAAKTLTCDNLPVGWTTDAGTSKTIAIYVGDQIKNGTTATAITLERGFLDQTVPTYIVNTGMQVNTFSLAYSSRNKITGSVSFIGMGGSTGTVALDAIPDAATTGQVIAANANVGRIAEAGSQVTDPNWAKEFNLNINNNLRTIEAVDSSSPVGVNSGECTVTGNINTYFGSNSFLTKLYAGTATSHNARVNKNSQAVIVSLPRNTLMSGVPQVQGLNTDVMLSSDFQASIETTYTNAQVLMDRLEFYA